MDTVRTEPETPPTETDVEALYDRLFGTPALDTTQERDELDAYALVYEVAEQYPGVARQAARDGTAAHYRGEHPFRYSTGPRRKRGEVAQ